MKILLTTHQFFPQFTAGTEVLTYAVARELMQRGHTVHVFTGHPGQLDMPEDERFDEYEHDGIHVYRFHHAYVPMGGQKSMIKVGYNNPLSAAYFERLLQKFQPDVVHFFHLNRLGTGLIERTVHAGVPCFLTPTDFWLICPTGQLLLADGTLCSGPSTHAGNCVKHFAENMGSGLTSKVVRWIPAAAADGLAQLTKNGVLPAYPKHEEVAAISSRLGVNLARLNSLNGIIVPNGFIKELFIRHGVAPSLITQSAFGIDLAENDAAVRPRATAQPLRVGFIGTLAPHKGCHVLIEGFKRLPASSAVLKIYGKSDDFPEYAAQLMQLADGNASINFCGTFPNSEISKVLAELDVLVVPSLWYENTPLVVYSAQAAHCPVIATDLPGLAEVVRHDENGLLFKTGSAVALSRQLSRLIDEQELLERLSAQAQRPKSITTYVDELLKTWCSAQENRLNQPHNQTTK
jgi:glycosyltransferase involved in cell wall biosynthesis